MVASKYHKFGYASVACVEIFKPCVLQLTHCKVSQFVPRAPLFFAAKSQKNYFLKGNWAGERAVDRPIQVGYQMLGWLDSEQRRCDSSLCDSRKRKDYTNDGGASGWLLTPCCVSFSHTPHAYTLRMGVSACFHTSECELNASSALRKVCVRVCEWVSEWERRPFIHWGWGRSCFISVDTKGQASRFIPMLIGGHITVASFNLQ